jgi:hypothetical protein
MRRNREPIFSFLVFLPSRWTHAPEANDVNATGAAILSFFVDRKSCAVATTGPVAPTSPDLEWDALRSSG